MRGTHIQHFKTGFWRLRTSAVMVVLVLFQVTIPVWGQTPSEPEGLTLPLAVEIALRSNPGLQAVTTGQTLAQVGTQEARAGRLPTISVSEVVTNGNNPVYVFGSLLEQSRFAEKNFALDSLNNPDPLTNFRTQVQVRYPLFDQRRAQTQIAKAEIGEQQASAQREMVEQRLRFEVIRAYFGLLVAQANQRVADQAVETAGAEAKRVKDMFDSGMVVASDLLSIETQLAEFRQQQIQAKGDIQTAQAALNTVLGVAIDRQQSVTGTLEGQSFTVLPEAELITSALANHPEYRQAALAVEQRQKDQHGARGEYQPRTDLFATVGNSGHKLVNGSGDYAVGVSVTFDLFK
ncbi:MAG TPA: TolC family protein, partial [Acidobacteriota bacterium]|nr:TolC family protein [Acidobacteriota bacterium]